MKATHLQLTVISLLAFAGCSTTHPAHDSSGKPEPETVLVTYHVKAGKEAAFEAVLSRAWEIYRTERFVFAKPHIVVQDTEDKGKPRFVEIFTWVSRSIPEHAPDSVKTSWKQEESLCEARGGHYGIEPGEVSLVLPKPAGSHLHN